MPAVSPLPRADAFPASGTAPEPLRNPLRDRLAKAKREAVEAALSKGESWANKVLNGESGVRLDDLPALLLTLGLKIVGAEKVCVDADLLKSYEIIARRALAERSLIDEDAE